VTPLAGEKQAFHERALKKSRPLGDTKRVIRKISFIFLLAALAGATLAPAAGALDIGRTIAPASACPDQSDPEAPVATQERAMWCMTNFARRSLGLHGMSLADELELSAVHKSGDILRCDNFSHQACGREFTYWMQRLGYLGSGCWRAGENIAWGTGKLGSVRSIFTAWMHSPGHRENILGRYGQIGIGLEIGGLDGYSRAHVWTQDFGSHC
jgi:uncharacterized protein YkwD